MKTLDARMTRARELGVLYIFFSTHLPLFRNSLLRLVPSPLLSFFAGAQTQKKCVLFKKSEHEVAFPRKMA